MPYIREHNFSKKVKLFSFYPLTKKLILGYIRSVRKYKWTGERWASERNVALAQHKQGSGAAASEGVRGGEGREGACKAGEI